MDGEKLDKAAIIAAANYDNPFDEPAYDKKFYDGFIAGAGWLIQQPLSERLTDEEKESIIKFYKTVWGKSVHKIQSELTAIFGSELFTEK